MGRRFALALSLLGCSALSLPAVAQERIVSIGPATTELIMALGGEQSLIATDVSSPEPKGLPRVGYHRALAAEGILSLAPTRLVGSDEMGPPPALEQLRRAEDLAAWRAGLWDLLQELALYFGRLAFYQRDARPGELDKAFPEQVLEETVGLNNVLSLYRLLLQAGSYDQWSGQWDALRGTVLAMQEHGRRRYAAGRAQTSPDTTGER